MNRRGYLAATGVVTCTIIGGCLGDRTDEQSDLEIQRSSAPDEDGCIEEDILDFERLVLAPKLVGLLGLTTTMQYHLDLQSGEEIYLRITSEYAYHLPHLRVENPAGTAIIDERPVENIYTFVTERDGRYTVTISNERWADQGEWFVDLTWYNSTGCRPYS